MPVWVEGNIGASFVLFQSDGLHATVLVSVVYYILEKRVGHIAGDLVGGAGRCHTIQGFNATGDQMIHAFPLGLPCIEAFVFDGHGSVRIFGADAFVVDVIEVDLRLLPQQVDTGFHLQ